MLCIAKREDYQSPNVTCLFNSILNIISPASSFTWLQLQLINKLINVNNGKIQSFLLIKPIQLRDIYFNKVANILPQFVNWLITKLLIFWIELHKHPVLSLSVCAQVAQARALKEIILSMILRNGKTIRLCVGIFMIVMFAHFFGLIEVILVILVSSLS